jgi:hypothetical protein
MIKILTIPVDEETSTGHLTVDQGKAKAVKPGEKGKEKRF